MEKANRRKLGGRTDGISISNFNKKMGEIRSISLPPVVSCPNCALCSKGCYAVNVYRRRPTVRKAWDRNWRIYNDTPAKYFLDVKEFMVNRQASMKLFRWHVSGDIPSARYMEGMDLVASAFPTIEYLAFTKSYFIVDWYMNAYNKPDNLHLVLSGWPGLEMHNPHRLPVAWMQDGTEDRVPDDAIQCNSKCDSCGMCWQLEKLGKDVVLDKI